MRKAAVILLVFITVFNNSLAQNIENWVDSQKTVLYEKVYLHVDRELYSPGDYIWFKSYLVGAMGNRLLAGYKNVYVQLVSAAGKVVADRILLSHEGVANGDILITNSIPDGQYTIRAFTKYLENFGEESFFHKKIWILRARSSLDLGNSPAKKEPEIDVSFLPESGNLVVNSLNHVAFKSVDESGKGVAMSGTVVDENDTVVATFKTSFLGMGKFMLMPEEGKSYFAKIDGHPKFNYRFSNIQENGIALNYSDKGTNILFTVSRNILVTVKREIYLVASHKGVVLFYKKIELSGFSEALKISKNQFPEGISKITLLDSNYTELAERLIFITGHNEPTIKLSVNKTEFATREKAAVNIEVFLDQNDTLQSTFSVAVVNNDYFSSAGNNLTMYSFLLLDSELKGAIESPASFFVNDKELSSAEKLDLLMMVHGWRSYYWDDLVKFSAKKLTGWDDAGITVEGTVKAYLRNKPVVGGEVVLGPFSRNLLFEETRTDSLGRFRFDRLYLKDSARIMINAKNEKDRANTEIICYPTLTLQPAIGEGSFQQVIKDIAVPMKFYRENYYRQLKLSAFSPEKGSILLGNIDVIGKLKEKDDGHFRIYGEPDKSLKITKDDYTYLGILDYLADKVAGLVIVGDQISIRGGGTPLFLLDGVKVFPEMVEELVLHTHMSDIDKIEVLKGGFNMAVFGSEGGNGVIAIYTNKGNVDNEINRFVKGRIIQQVKGFRKPTQFYAPKYTFENSSNPAPDYRPTLHWEPGLQVVNGKAGFEFFTSDELSNYSVIVEGISKNGKICTATGSFTANTLND